MKVNYRNIGLKITSLLIVSVLFVTCRTVPVTGRKQVNLLPESDLVQMSFNTYDEFMNEHKVVRGSEASQTVKNVGNNISIAVEKFLRRKGRSGMNKYFNWEFNLVDMDVPNAWCMPGGKVAIYTGILPYTKDANGLAVVMGHEIAHAVARHGNERMSQQLLVQLGGLALNVALNEKPEKTRQLFMAAYGLTSTVGVMLPYSRTHESEADKLGLIFMAMAGYNPGEAIDFWTRMSKAGGNAPPEFLSTHPSHATRIENLEEFMPEAMKYYEE
jgi:predicted Zn-dependent protease